MPLQIEIDLTTLRLGKMTHSCGSLAQNATTIIQNFAREVGTHGHARLTDHEVDQKRAPLGSERERCEHAKEEIAVGRKASRLCPLLFEYYQVACQIQGLLLHKASR